MSGDTFGVKMFRKIVEYILNTRLFGYLLKKVLPFIRSNTYYTTFTGAQYHRGYNLLRPGDYILCTDYKKLTTQLIPGKYSHAAFCISKDGVWEISDMTYKNYRKICFFDICKESDLVEIFRPINKNSIPWDLKYVSEVIECCRSLQDTTYDQQFNLDAKSLYCFELIYHCDFERRLEIKLEDFMNLGRPYVSGDALANCKSYRVWSSEQ